MMNGNALILSAFENRLRAGLILIRVTAGLNVRCQFVLFTIIGSRIRSFDWYRNWWHSA